MTHQTLILIKEKCANSDNIYNLSVTHNIIYLCNIINMFKCEYGAYYMYISVTTAKIFIIKCVIWTM